MSDRLQQLWTRRRALAIIALLLAGSGVVGAVRFSRRSPTVPTFVLKREEFLDSLQVRGEVKALRSATISAPPEADNLEIMRIAADGTQVKQGDVVVEFDKTKTEQDFAQYRSTLKSAQAEIEQARAEARLADEEDQTALIKARYAVETAKLEASKQEILSKIEGQEKQLELADAEQKLHEAEAKLKSDQALHQSTVKSKRNASKKAVFDVKRAEHALTEMNLRAPTDGMISLIQHWHSDGQTPFKAGDQVWPGVAIAELPDASSLQVSARADETERGRLAPRQPVTIQLEAIPDRQLAGHVERISTIASLDFSGGWPFPRNFNLEIVLDQTDPRLKPGMTAQLTVVVERLPNTLSSPVQSLFQKSGRNVAYVWAGTKFEERVIEVGKRSGDRVLVVKGLRPGERIALKDPSLNQ